ncbi:unnamed protein product [Caenorhabditis auriculariae]|uniref:G-protein coupled receptors family 3 profile domain-containing protein n=1 Tax=Caenorhabditis auriculariae TaxID=2777116 RepID=A0A8S1GYI4_9PELO|nr:unnamed protein product [Caenorhabditis auriculariae]
MRAEINGTQLTWRVDGLPPLQIKVGSRGFFDGFIVAINDWSRASVTYEVTALGRISKELASNRLDSLVHAEEGTLAAMRLWLGDGDDVWVRVFVQKRVDVRSVKVFLVDMAVSKTVPVRDLRSLPQELSFTPPTAFPVRISTEQKFPVYDNSAFGIFRNARVSLQLEVIDGIVVGRGWTLYRSHGSSDIDMMEAAERRVALEKGNSLGLKLFDQRSLDSSYNFSSLPINGTTSVIPGDSNAQSAVFLLGIISFIFLLSGCIMYILSWMTLKEAEENSNKSQRMGASGDAKNPIEAEESFGTVTEISKQPINDPCPFDSQTFAKVISYTPRAIVVDRFAKSKEVIQPSQASEATASTATKFLSNIERPVTFLESHTGSSCESTLSPSYLDSTEFGGATHGSDFDHRVYSNPMASIDVSDEARPSPRYATDLAEEVLQRRRQLRLLTVSPPDGAELSSDYESVAEEPEIDVVSFPEHRTAVRATTMSVLRLLQLPLLLLLLNRPTSALDFRPQALRTIDHSSPLNVFSPPPASSFEFTSNPYEQLGVGPSSTSSPAPPNPLFVYSSTAAPNTPPWTLPTASPNVFYSYSSSKAPEPPNPIVSFPLAELYKPAPVPKIPPTTTNPPFINSFTTHKTTSTPVLWTTTPSSSTTEKNSAKMSRLSVRPTKKTNGVEAAQVSVLSHRLLNDILVIPSARRLYVLAILPIHESTNHQRFECGNVDVNAFIPSGGVNSAQNLKETGLNIGAVVVDTCSSDLRTVADLYELLSGTNIHRNDLIAIVRDDASHMPNVEQLARHLRLPVLNTFFTSTPQPFTTGTMPSMSAPLEAMIALLHHTHSSCVSLLHDELHEESARSFLEMASKTSICVEQKISLKSGGKAVAESGIRRLLLTQARVVIVLLGESTWIDMMKAFRSEMVIAGRFILIAAQDPRWSTSKHFTEAWPQFDQLLLTVAPEKSHQESELLRLATKMPQLAFPQHWLRQFWSTAFKCHIEGDEVGAAQQFSKECSSKQLLNMTSVSPDIDIAPITLAVHAIAYSLRSLVDNLCPGALVMSLNDCVNDPLEPMFQSILALNFYHILSERGVSFNVSTGYRDIPMLVNRVLVDSQLEFETVARWDTISGFEYTADAPLIMEERDGARASLISTCPKSKCAFELEKRAQSGQKPMFQTALRDVRLLIFAISSVVAFFVCLMCMYQKVVSSNEQYRVCTAFMFTGLAMLCLASASFVMPPNAISCSVRKVFFPIALASVCSPLLTKTLCIWRMTMTSNAKRVRPTTMFSICMALVLLQAVISFEWAFFTSATDVIFVSTTHGNSWRCSQGDSVVRNSRSLLLFLVGSFRLFLIYLFDAVIAQRPQPTEPFDIHLQIIAILLAIGLYVSLPLLSYAARDSLLAATLLLFSFLTLVTSYCRQAFSRSNDSSMGSLIDKSTMQKSDKEDHWLDHVVMSPREQYTLKSSFHQASTLPHTLSTKTRSHDGPNTSTLPGGVPARRNTIQRSSHYGVEAYEMPPTSPHELPSNLSLYGKMEFENESHHAHL